MNRLLLLLLLNLNLYAQAASDDETVVLEKLRLFGQRLKTELLQAISKSPSHAVRVCSERATAIAEELSSAKLLLGRVSHKPRNPNNRIRPWMKATADEYLAKARTTPFASFRIPTP
jgi:hypothetical protein